MSQAAVAVSNSRKFDLSNIFAKIRHFVVQGLNYLHKKQRKKNGVPKNVTPRKNYHFQNS